MTTPATSLYVLGTALKPLSHFRSVESCQTCIFYWPYGTFWPVMVDGGDLSNWTSVVSVFFGGFFWAYSYLQGKYARRIITAHRVSKLDGE